MAVLKIKKGKHNDSSFRIPQMFTGQFKKTWTVSLSPYCFYDWGEDKDQEDINKLVGVTEFWSKNNVNSVMIGWNPCLLPEAEILEKFPYCKNLSDTPILSTRYFNIYYYINDSKGNHVANLIGVIADWRINDLEITMERASGSNDVITKVNILQANIENDINSPKIWKSYSDQILYYPLGKMLREIFIWFGGANNSPGPHGGVAPHDMLLKVN